MEWISSLCARRHVRASFYRAALEDLPDGLEAGWRDNTSQEYPGIRTDAFFFARAAEGLMYFFSAAACSSQPCALPSEAADSVWHAWLRRDPIGLERFCRRYFGASVPHVERAGLGVGALANALVMGRACPHPELTFDALLTAGVVDVRMVDAQRRRQVVDDGDDESFTDGILAAVFSGDSDNDTDSSSDD